MKEGDHVIIGQCRLVSVSPSDPFVWYSLQFSVSQLLICPFILFNILKNADHYQRLLDSMCLRLFLLDLLAVARRPSLGCEFDGDVFQAGITVMVDLG